MWCSSTRQWLKNRASPITKVAMREMLQIIKADERQTGADFPLENHCAEFCIALQHPSATCITIQLRSGYWPWLVDVEEKQQSPDSTAWESLHFQFRKLIFDPPLPAEHANMLRSYFNCQCFYLRTKSDTMSNKPKQKELHMINFRDFENSRKYLKAKTSSSFLKLLEASSDL